MGSPLGVREDPRGRRAPEHHPIRMMLAEGRSSIVEQAMGRLPGARLLAHYKLGWLRSDLVAGIVLATLLVPQGMAYAELAGLPAITGLYTSILCLIGYAVFGPSRVLVLGPDSSLGPMIAATIAPLLLANGDPAGPARLPRCRRVWGGGG